MLRLFWQNKIKFNWVFGLILILLFGVPRFIIVLNANVTGNYGYISIIFLLMWITPWIFLTKEGRKNIGIRKPGNYRWLIYSFLAGAAICAILFVTGILLFNQTYSNWFVYISNSYQSIGIISTDSQRLTYFLIYAVIGMTFSPIGEELFYRGIVHGSFAGEFGEHNASIIDSMAFALTHLAHFGIIYMSGMWHFLFIPAILWITFMFITSRIFFICKQKTGSIYGAIIGHAAFNLTMMYFIFYYILK
jgi:membrane protease YdiL (CAAX protease family)